MNFALAATALALVVPAELPDKTFVSSVVLSTRHRPLPVFAGAAAALVLQAAIAVVLGRLIGLLPHRTVEIVVAVAFLAGAAFLLLTRERPPPESASSVPDETGAVATRVPARRIALTTFAVVGIAEIGDLTQVLIANLAARYRDPVSVFAGAAVALVAVAAVGVVAGRALVRIVPLGVLRKLSGLVMLGLGAYSLVSAVVG